jgi:hypothetical protein
MTDASAPTKTPIHLWIVGIIGLLWSSIGAMDYFMTQTANESYMQNFTPEQLEFFYGLPTWSVATWALGVWGGVLGTLLLLLRKKLAVPVLLVSLIAAVLTTVHNYAVVDGFAVMGGAGALVFSLLILVVAGALYWYARKMSETGVIY